MHCLSMECPICIRLAAERDRMDSLYTVRLEELAVHGETADIEIFSKAASLAMNAKIDRDIARLELEKHRARHGWGCLVCASLLARLANRELVNTSARGIFALIAESTDSRQYRSLKIAVDDSRIECELARVELEQHQAGHTAAN
jgi:hypothetical protein